MDPGKRPTIEEVASIMHLKPYYKEYEMSEFDREKFLQTTELKDILRNQFLVCFVLLDWTFHGAFMKIQNIFDFSGDIKINNIRFILVIKVRIVQT